MMRIATFMKVVGLLALAAALGTSGACGDDDPPTPDVTDVTDTADAADEGGTCTGGLTWCDGECVDTDLSTEHCGECGNACGAGRVCVAGECTLNCPTFGRFDDCGGARCANLDSDPAHCGACNRACAAEEVCNCGECTSACSDLDTDRENCGRCGNACAPTEVCCCGKCLAICDGAACDPPIPALEPCVAGGCYDTRWDFYNCGSCGHVCSAGMRCGGGACTTESCVTGEDYCDGHCVNLASDINNCGRCGRACNRDLETCFNGTCVVM